MFGRKNNKGFSLVELLAAIVIMGILTGIGIVSVTYLINKTEKEYYKAQESEIIMAAKSYTQDNRSFLPKRVGQKNQVYLKTLQDKKYIGEVIDRNKKICDPNQSYVQVYRYSKNDYSYVVNLVCDGYTSEDSSPTNLVGPDIKFVFEGIGANDNYDLAKVTITIEDEDKISGYRYIITKNGNEVKNSGDIDGKLEKKIEFTLPLKEYVPGIIEIKVIATDFYGNESNKKEQKTIVNSTAPTCTVLKENTTWTNGVPVETQVKCNDFTGLGCKKDVYTQDFYNDAKVSVVEIEDNAGNKGICNVNTYIDVTPPTGPVIENAYENTWTNTSYTIKVTSVDEMSGIAFIEYRYPDSNGKDGNGNPENEWHRYENSSKDPGDNTPFVTTAFSKERGEYVEIRACDNVGNCSSNKSMIKIDKTSPSCSVHRSPSSPNGNNGWYNTSVTVSVTYSEPDGTGDRAVASPVSYGLSSGGTSTTQSDTAGTSYSGYVSDAAGNSSSCSSGSFKVDTVGPSISFGISGTNGTTATSTCSDSLSGLSGSSSGSMGLSGKSSVTYTRTCTDKAGNSTTSSHTYSYNSCKSKKCVGGQYCSDCYKGSPNTCVSGTYEVCVSSVRRRCKKTSTGWVMAPGCNSACYGTGGTPEIYYCDPPVCTKTETRTDPCRTTKNTCTYGCDPWDDCYTKKCVGGFDF